MTTSGSRSMRELLRSAYRVTGPLDASINLALNASIAWFFLRSSGPVPVFGLPSVYGFLGPMVACVLCCTIVSGYRNGTHWSRPSQTCWKHWLPRGLGWGIAGAMLGSGCCLMMVKFVDWAGAGASWMVWQVILADGIAAALLGYVGQVMGVWVAVCRSSSR